MFEHYIVISNGYWGGGSSPSKARSNWRKAGGRGDTILFKCTSTKPFAPPNREATEDEADAYINGYGGLVTKDCDAVMEEVVDK